MFADYTLEILYQDNYLVAINKPSGLLVHRSPIDKHEIYFAMKMLKEQLGGQWVYPIHRLDKPTSGVLLFALDKETARLMNEQFATHSVQKTYIAVVRGYTDESGVVDYPLKEKLDKIADKDARDDKAAQNAITHYETLSRVEFPDSVGRYDTVRYSLVKLKPKTGRKHQLRRHMKHIDHHLLGDTKYGRGEHNKYIRKKFGVHRLLLHAIELECMHPYTQEKLCFKAPCDDVFSRMTQIFQKENR